MNSKKIVIIGFFAFIVIILLLTLIFNWFWSGLGDDPSRYKILPLTNDLNDFKDYASLYIPLISFGATIFAGFVVFLVFNDWKVQHNQNIDSKYYDQALESFKNISITVRKFKTLYEECNYISENGRCIDIQYFQSKYKDNKNELLLNLDIFQSELIFLKNLNQNTTEQSKIESIFLNYIKKSKENINNKDIIHNFYNSYTEYEEFEEDLKKSSVDQGKLILDNMKFIVDFLNSKIKVK